MTFKKNWEKANNQHKVKEDLIHRMLKVAYPKKKLISFRVIEGGCANLNIIVHLEGNSTPLILRIYIRDKDAVYRERKLSGLLKETIPIPKFCYVGDSDGYKFAITEFIPGISLRELLLSDTTHNISSIMHDVGVILSKITSYKFSSSGFFDQNLNITNKISKNGYLSFAKGCLKNQLVLDQLGSDITARLGFYLDKYGDFFPSEEEKSLVHADFDPSNILVDKIDGSWKVTGILDWEFSFSGSLLCDVANMLRYAHQMPPEFEGSFLKGLENDKAINLPENWCMSVYMLNILSLLDCLSRSDPKSRPNQCDDICELIIYFINQVEGFKYDNK